MHCFSFCSGFGICQRNELTPSDEPIRTSSPQISSILMSSRSFYIESFNAPMRAGILLFTCHSCSHCIIFCSLFHSREISSLEASCKQAVPCCLALTTPSISCYSKLSSPPPACLVTAHWGVRCLCGSVSLAAS